MKPDMFKEPVSILIGLGFPIQVRSVTEAYRHLVEWRSPSRGAAHSIALNACKAALRGEVDAETVRGLFTAFAERHDLLAPDNGIVVAARSRRDRDPHIA
ncbi:DUF982 domain-containing protein [Shinella sp. M31]|uniref:DUF982 domain-containing protein n=1 Tax=Shinella sp. M31 TaxID=3368615 RepID=UPI003B9E65E5